MALSLQWMTPFLSNFQVVRDILARLKERTYTMLTNTFGCLLVVLMLECCFTANSQTNNGIHVGAPRIYDSRALTLMLNDIGQSLKNPNFIDPIKLAAVLGNLQGYNSQDFAQQLNVKGAVGPQAASVVAGVSNSGGTGSGASSGLAIPAVPSLQTPPSFTPNFGSSAGDLLTDEVNLTYQYNNVRMLLDRSLSDRLYARASRLQAVIGFDVDLEPPSNATDAVAVVDMEATITSCDNADQSDCNANGNLTIVAMMPEEGSHNAATLSQKANAFGGAVAAKIFSVGYAAQKRSQVFYLYRDMDTVSYQGSGSIGNTVHFGWQFRPVLGRRSVTPGTRHMMAVLALPAKDLSSKPGGRTPVPRLSVMVKTKWIRYQAKTQTTTNHHPWFKPDLPHEGGYASAIPADVPTTDATQETLGLTISEIKWVPTDASTGVAIVRGTNFFSGTKVNFGSKVYATESDGLVIKSDHELEVALPLSAAVAGGVLSGRYGAAKLLEARDPSLPVGFSITQLRFFPEGTDMFQLLIDLTFTAPVTVTDLAHLTNPPIVLVKGLPIATPPFQSQLDTKTILLTTFVPASSVQGGAATVTVNYPFAGPGWMASLPHYDASVNVTRLGGADLTRLLISVNDKTLKVCDGDTMLQLDAAKIFKLDVRTGDTLLKCLDSGHKVLSFDIRSNDLKQYKRFTLVHSKEAFPPLVGDVPAAAPPPPGPSLDKTQTVSVAVGDVKAVSFTGSNLDQVTKVLFGGKAELPIAKKSGTSISITLSKEVTATAGSKEFQLISDGNDFVTATLTVVTPKAGS